MSKKTTLQQLRSDANRREKLNNQWYDLNPILGNQWAMFYILIGAREAGKSYAVMEYCLRQWKEKGTPFTWVRLTAVSTQKMLANKADKLVDPDLRRKYDLDLTVKGMDVFDHGKKMCKVLALSEMAKEKGVALFDADYDGYYNIVCDEFQREPSEKRTFDVSYNLVGTLENLCRSRKHKVRIFMICNLLEECNEVLADGFDFIPEDFGIYKLVKNKKALMCFLDELEATKTAEERQKIYEAYKDIDFGKRAVIHYIAPSLAYLTRRKGTIADILSGSQSNFTNFISQDRSLIFTGKLRKPFAIIKFTKSRDDWFTIWDNGIIAQYNKETLPTIIPMRPYVNEVFSPDARDSVILRYDARAFQFRDMITQKKFEKNLTLLRQTR